MDPARATAMWDHRAATIPTPAPEATEVEPGDWERAAATGAGAAGTGAGDAITMKRAREDIAGPALGLEGKSTAAASAAASPAPVQPPASAPIEPFQRQGAAVLLVSEGETETRVHAEALGECIEAPAPC